MPLSLSDWQAKLKSRWQAWAAKPAAILHSLGSNSMYFAMAGTALYPIAEAVARGDLAAVGLLYQLGAGVGVNLIANAVQGWADEGDAAQALETAAADNAELVRALDVILNKVQALENIAPGLTPADREWFQRELGTAVARAGSTLAVGLIINTGSGALVVGGGVGAGQGGVAVGGDVHGDVVIHNNPPPVAASESASLSEAEQLTLYLEQVKSDHSLLRLGGISSDASDPQKRLTETRNPGMLAEVFISLRIDRYKGEPGERAAVAEADRFLRSEREQFTALQAISEDDGRRVVLLGQPGAGKSSVLRYLAYRLAEGYQQPARLENVLPEWKLGARLPVFVPLARLADELPVTISGATLGQRARTFVNALVESSDDLRGFAQRIWREARDHGVLFLFDGLDAVALEKRAVVKDAIQALLAPLGQCRAVVTCRTFSYGDERWRLEGWPAYQLEPLSDKEQKDFVHRWYAALLQRDPTGKALYDQKAESLIRAVFSGDARQLQQISSNSLLLTLITIVHTHREELPRSRIRIYEECVELLLLRWQTRRQPGAPLRSVVEAMAEAAPQHSQGLENRLMRGLYEMAFRAREGHGLALRQGETTLIDQHALRAALQPKLGEAATEIFLEYCQSANGLLLAHGSRRLPDRPADEDPTPCFALPHPSFEEYLAARYLATLDQPQVVLATNNAESDRWFFVGLFLAQYQAIVAQRPRDMRELVTELLKTRATPAWRNVWLAGVVWPVFCAEFPDRRANEVILESRLHERLLALCVTGQLAPRERADAGRALAELGDPRDLEELVTIPAGKFWMGSEEEALLLDERPQHEVSLPEYRLGKYPVTVGQWKRFVQANPTLECGSDSLKGPDNHPAHDVSWHDARAYCDWLTSEWRKAGKIRPTEVVRLPTEAEWEKAARGTDKFEWPWGNEFDDDRANTSESGIGRTCAVGLFLRGASPYGCLDMAGNVSEWCQSKPEDYPYNVNDGREKITQASTRVLRGGAFFNNRWFARCAYRDLTRPDGRFDLVGFRICVVSPALALESLTPGTLIS